MFLPVFAVIDEVPLWAWGAFAAFIAVMLALDLGVFQRDSHEVKMKEAILWCLVWFALALGFNGLLLGWSGPEPAQQFLAAYLVELCLSVDNVFVFILVFAYFKIPPRYQHRVLFWGILGAVIMRCAFILTGIELLRRFHWIIYVFGAFLVYTGIKMALPREQEDVDPSRNIIVRLFRRFFRVSTQMETGRFFIKEDGRRVATTLFVVLLVVETTDFIFALDSLPAVLAVTKNGFVAFTSNVFAILGLRSLYFALSGVMKLFRFLKIGLSVILVFIGVKMLIEPWVPITTSVSLGVIGGVLTVSVLMSMLIPVKEDTLASERHET